MTKMRPVLTDRAEAAVLEQIEVREVTPEQMGFPHGAQIARVDRIRELRTGRPEVETTS